MKLYVVHNTQRKRFKCVFCSLVIKNESLAKFYNGGLQGFMDKHRLFCNENITIGNFMGDGVDAIVDDLIENAMKMDEDFTFLDATRLAFNVQSGLSPIALKKDVNIGVDWLKVKYDNGNIYIRYADDKPEIHNDRKSKGGQTNVT
jgi:hypothetical protein